MGYHTVILVRSDAMNEIKDHPSQFVEAIDLASVSGTRTTKDIAVGRHANAAQVERSVHDNFPELLLASGGMMINFCSADVRRFAARGQFGLMWEALQEAQALLREFERNLRAAEVDTGVLMPKGKKGTSKR